MNSGDQFTREQLNDLANLANSKPIEGRPYRFWGMLSVFYCQSADNAEVLASIPNPKNVAQIPLTNSKATSWWPVGVGDIAMNLQTSEAFVLERYPQTDFANWRQLGVNELAVNSQPVGSNGQGSYLGNGAELQFPGQFVSALTLWHFFYVFRDGVWDSYGGWLTELNRMRHNVQRALADNDPSRYPTKAWLKFTEELAVTGPWVLSAFVDGLGRNALAAGSFDVISGGLGPRKVYMPFSGWQSGHQLKEIQCWWSDEVASTTLPDYRLEPEWSHIRVSTDEYAQRRCDKTGFRYEGPGPATFNAWMYCNTTRPLILDDPTPTIESSHPQFLAEFSTHSPVATGMSPDIVFGWRFYSVNGVRIQGTLQPGETFWIQHINSFGTVGTDGSSTGGYNGETIRGRFVPARHPEIDSEFGDALRASVGEPFALYTALSPSGTPPDTGVLHSTRNFRTRKFSSVMSTFPMDGADRTGGRTLALTGQTGLFFCGFHERYRNPSAEVPQLIAFAAKTLPPYRLMSIGATGYQLTFAPNAKGRSPPNYVPDQSDPNRIYLAVAIADNNLFYPYPCIRVDRPQIPVILPEPYAGWTEQSPSGMIFKIEVRRTPINSGGVDTYTAAGSAQQLNVRVGCMVNGIFKPYSTIVLLPGINYAFQRVTYPTYGAPVAYECNEDPNICVTAIFVPINTIGQQGDLFQYPNVYRATDGHKWIAKPLFSDDYNGVATMLNKVPFG